MMTCNWRPKPLEKPRRLALRCVSTEVLLFAPRLLMRRYHLAQSISAPGRPSLKNSASRLADPSSRVVRMPRRLRRPPRVDVAFAGMEAERATLDAFLTERGHDRRHAQHLVVMVNGLNGAPTNWSVLKEQLIASLDGATSRTIFYASHANRRLHTFGGICSCAKRLSEEILSVVKSYPNLMEISFLVHSMGGLISRYACGVHYDPENKTIFGLKPRHYLSIASPHLGCAVDGEAQVPFLGWGQAIPLMGPFLLRPLISRFAPFVVTHIYRLTGRQLFLMDGRFDGEQVQMPLLCRLVDDLPEEGYFLSALKSFQSRTCYANVRQDALVGWANASLRRLAELPGTVDQPLSSSISCRMDLVRCGMWMDISPITSSALSDTLPEDWKKKHEMVEFMLKRLQSMPWCRIDVSFHGSFFPLLAHTHIQVTRKWIDSEGLPVVKHIVDTYSKLDSLVSEPSH